jgi:hypothetical protein
MIANQDEFEELPPRDKASLLVAIDELTDARIAEKVGISAPTLYRWKRDPEFLAAVDAHNAAFREIARRKGAAILDRRVAALNDRLQRMKRVIDERGDDPGMQGVPGGKTGLLVRTVKAVGRGEDFELIDLYEVDTGLLKELREHEKQAAQELGQWAERTEISGKDGGPLLISVIEVVKPAGADEPDPDTTH